MCVCARVCVWKMEGRGGGEGQLFWGVCFGGLIVLGGWGGQFVCVLFCFV